MQLRLKVFSFSVSGLVTFVLQESQNHDQYCCDTIYSANNTRTVSYRTLIIIIIIISRRCDIRDSLKTRQQSHQAILVTTRTTFWAKQARDKVSERRAERAPQTTEIKQSPRDIYYSQIFCNYLILRSACNLSKGCTSNQYLFLIDK